MILKQIWHQYQSTTCDKYLNYAMLERFNSFKNAMHKKFKKYSSKTKALQTQPKEIKDQEDWIYLYDLCASEKFKLWKHIFFLSIFFIVISCNIPFDVVVLETIINIF